MSTRILVVDDTVVFRRLVSDALAGVPEVEVVGTAPHGKLALARIAELQPDLVTLDIEMPEMNGIQVLEAMRAAGITAGVIVLSAHTRRGGELTVRALQLGAFDFLTKPDADGPAESLALLREQLVPLVQEYARKQHVRMLLRNGGPPPKPREAANVEASRVVSRHTVSMLLIGSSTGGPKALAELIPALPADLGIPVFIVQHMPPLFTEALAASLDKSSAIRVSEAHEGELAVANHAYIAPGGKHMKLVSGSGGGIFMRLTADPPEHHCRPSVDYLFRSAALNFPGRANAAILTGMGSDGTLGLRLLKRSGCFAVAQDEATSVVFGMPKEAIAAGVVDAVLPLGGIASALIRSVRGPRS